MPKICKNCGKLLPDVSRFCTGCGGSDLALQQAAPQQDVRPQAGQPQRRPEAHPQYGGAPQDPAQPKMRGETEAKKSSKNWIIACIAAVLVVGVAVCILAAAGVFNSKNVDTIESTQSNENTQQSLIEGVWYEDAYDNELIAENGRITIYTNGMKNKSTGTYTVSDNVLYVKYDDGYIADFIIEYISNDKLTLAYTFDFEGSEVAEFSYYHRIG